MSKVFDCSKVQADARRFFGPAALHRGGVLSLCGASGLHHRKKQIVLVLKVAIDSFDRSTRALRDTVHRGIRVPTAQECLTCGAHDQVTLPLHQRGFWVVVLPSFQGRSEASFLTYHTTTHSVVHATSHVVVWRFFKMTKRTRFDYKGKFTLVTGASKGLGKAYAEELAVRGSNL